MKSSDAKASKCHLKFSSLMMIFVKLVYLSSVIRDQHYHLGGPKNARAQNRLTQTKIQELYLPFVFTHIGTLVRLLLRESS